METILFTGLVGGTMRCAGGWRQRHHLCHAGFYLCADYRQCHQHLRCHIRLYHRRDWLSQAYGRLLARPRLANAPGFIGGLIGGWALLQTDPQLFAAPCCGCFYWQRYFCSWAAIEALRATGRSADESHRRFRHFPHLYLWRLSGRLRHYYPRRLVAQAAIPPYVTVTA